MGVFPGFGGWVWVVGSVKLLASVRNRTGKRYSNTVKAPTRSGRAARCAWFERRRRRLSSSRKARSAFRTTSLPSVVPVLTSPCFPERAAPFSPTQQHCCAGHEVRRGTDSPPLPRRRHRGAGEASTATAPRPRSARSRNAPCGRDRREGRATAGSGATEERNESRESSGEGLSRCSRPVKNHYASHKEKGRPLLRRLLQLRVRPALRLGQSVDLLLAQVDRRGAEVLLQLLDRPGADDRRGHAVAVHQPR